MDKYDENRRDVMKPLGFRDVQRVGARFAPDVSANNRRALRDVKNLMNDPHPWAVGKRGGNSDKIAIGEKPNNNGGVPFAARRPITRRFAATLKSQSGSQCVDAAGKENSSRTAVLQPPSHSTSMDTSLVIDVDDYKSFDNYKLFDDYKPFDDLPLPMLEEKNEEMQCDSKEVEMEDIVEELKPDIDGSNRDNPLAMVDYVESIYNSYREMEKSGSVSPDYMSNQFDINEKMRAILIDWLIEVHYKFELMDETLYLTVNIIDRFLEKETVVRKKLQLVGVTAMLLACKYEEVSVPVVEDLILISDRAYTRKEVLDMEKLIVNTLKFNMSVPTPYVFMRRFLKAANSDKKLELLSFFIIELCLVEYRMLKFKPSLSAAAAVYTAQSALLGLNHWTKISELHSCYTEEQLLECSKMMVDLHQKAGTGKLTGVHRKYSTFKFGFAAKCEPALFLLDIPLTCLN